MKKIYTFIAVLFIGSGILLAQPVLNATDFLPNPTWSLNSYFVNDTPGLSAGAAGANATWNFSGIIATLVGVTSIVPVESSPYIANFPTANFVAKDSNVDVTQNPYFNYWRVSSTNMETVGGAESNAPDIETDHAIWFTFPYTYGTVFTDTYQHASEVPISHTFTKTYDAYGTLITPYGTYNNVIRQKEVEDNGNSINTNYLFFTANPFKIITSMGFTSNGNGNYIGFYAATNLGVAQNSINKTIVLFPNPTNSILKIQTQNSISAIKITDISGRTTSIKTFVNNSIDVSSLASGVYFVEVQTMDGNFREKFVKN